MAIAIFKNNLLHSVGRGAFFFISMWPNVMLFSLMPADNAIRADGAKALAEALKVNTTLSTLNLDSMPHHLWKTVIKEPQESVRHLGLF